jgi:hypothetical protein
MGRRSMMNFGHFLSFAAQRHLLLLRDVEPVSHRFVIALRDELHIRVTAD